MPRVLGAAADLAQTRRMISFLAALSLLAGLYRGWRSAAIASPVAAVWIPIGFLLAFAAIVAAAVITVDLLHRLDVAVLVVAGVLFFVENVAAFQPSYAGITDESRLGRGALKLLRAGTDPYGAVIPEHTGTHLLSGGIVTHYAYPPLTVEIGWLLSHVAGRLGEPWIITTIATVVTGVVAFVLLPQPLRALAVTVVFGLGMFDDYAVEGFPVIVALPLLCLAVWRWTDIGAGGRLGRWGVVQAIALGLAAATQQLAWFVAALLVVAVWAVRRGSLSTPAATWLALRFAVIAIAAFAVVNAPFAIWDARSWLSGITAVFRQEAVPFGGGLVLICVAVIGHCANFRFLTLATGWLALVMLGVTAFGIRRIGPAVPVLASALFLVSARSDVEYFVAFLPVWLVWLATTDHGVLAATRPVFLPGRHKPALSSARARAVVLGVALLPTLGLCAYALGAAAPLGLQVRSVVAAGTRPASMVVTVTNRTSQQLDPTFAVGVRGRGHPWLTEGGRLRLGPGRTRTVVIAPAGHRMIVQPGWLVSAFTTSPATLSSGAVPVYGKLPGGPRGRLSHRHRHGAFGRR